MTVEDESLTAKDARRVLEDAHTARIFPAAVYDVGHSAQSIIAGWLGTRTFDDATPIARDTPFDLASLSKPIVTTTVVMQLVESGRLRLVEQHVFADGGERIYEVDLLCSGFAEPPNTTRRKRAMGLHVCQALVGSGWAGRATPAARSPTFRRDSSQIASSP